MCRHFYPNGNACLFLKDEEYKHYSSQNNILEFIETCVKSFFVWQIDYDSTSGNPTMKARSHNIKGNLEFYQEELGISDLYGIIKFLEYHTCKKVKGHWPCYCGSGKELRRCHRDKVMDMRNKVKRSDGEKFLKGIKGLLEKS